jgi:hypothetical protein
MIGIDFDNTIARHDTFGAADDVGEPIPGAIQFIKAVKQLGFDIVIFSARAIDPLGKKAIEQWVDENGLSEYIEFVTHEKLPSFKFIVDDRAIHFAGDYKAVIKEIIRRGQ